MAPDYIVVPLLDGQPSYPGCERRIQPALVNDRVILKGVLRRGSLAGRDDVTLQRGDLLFFAIGPESEPARVVALRWTGEWRVDDDWAELRCFKWGAAVVRRWLATAEGRAAWKGVS